ncbi:hypothetical protein HPB49_014652 [Dermacentor silvarum]|uniref:Uncharacterized protein n=1 Tax=Dermacentor silvarum TaxID=543639 RepID=A0ACB8D623_DERSI|nr:hypothetical protein HPB49_014652 [Dermacentor silvarum]
MLRSLSYPIPSNRTLIRRLQNIRFLPGILHEVLNVLKHKVEAMEDIEKDCVLFMDEMEISQGFDHDRSLDCLFGGTTLPEATADVANHALVFMVGGLNTRWKQVQSQGDGDGTTSSGVDRTAGEPVEHHCRAGIISPGQEQDAGGTCQAHSSGPNMSSQ